MRPREYSLTHPTALCLIPWHTNQRLPQVLQRGHAQRESCRTVPGALPRAASRRSGARPRVGRSRWRWTRNTRARTAAGGSDTCAQMGHASKAPAMPTGTIWACVRLMSRWMPAFNGCIRPSEVRAPFGKDEDGLAGRLEVLQDAADAFLADPFLIDRHGVQAADEAAEVAIAEEGLAGQVRQRPTRRQPDQRRIEIALMIGHQERLRSRSRHVARLAPGAAS